MQDEINLLDEEISINTSPKQIPIFLQVLCILTFVGAGITTLSTLFSIFTIGQLENSMKAMDDVFSNTDSGIDFGNSYRWTKISYVLSLIGAILCLTGALFMWRLKKIGFYIYIIGQILPLIGSFMTMNSMFKNSMFAGFGMIAMVFGMLFPVAFIIMYGLNLKHMK